MHLSLSLCHNSVNDILTFGEWEWKRREETPGSCISMWRDRLPASHASCLFNNSSLQYYFHHKHLWYFYNFCWPSIFWGISRYVLNLDRFRECTCNFRNTSSTFFVAIPLKPQLIKAPMKLKLVWSISARIYLQTELIRTSSAIET